MNDQALDDELRALGMPAGAAPDASAVVLLARATPAAAVGVSVSAVAALVAAALVLGVGLGVGGTAVWSGWTKGSGEPVADIAGAVVPQSPRGPQGGGGLTSEDARPGAGSAAKSAASSVLLGEAEGAASRDAPSEKARHPGAWVATKGETSATQEPSVSEKEAEEIAANGVAEEANDSEQGSVAVEAEEIAANGVAEEANDSEQGSVAVEADDSEEAVVAAPTAVADAEIDASTGQIGATVPPTAASRHVAFASVGGMGVMATEASVAGVDAPPLGAMVASGGWSMRTGALSGFSPAVHTTAQLNLIGSEGSYRPAGTVVAGVDASWEWGKARLDAGWSVAALGLGAPGPGGGPPASTGGPPSLGEQPRALILTGPELSASFGPKEGPRLRAGLATRIAPRALADQQDAVFFGLDLGVDFPVFGKKRG